MTAQKHTPGPWVLDDFPEYVDGTDMEVLDGDNFPVANIEASPILNRWNERYPEMGHWADGADDGKTHRHRSQEELLANARLIAAAPAMLNGYHRIAESEGMQPGHVAYLSRAEIIAIAKDAIAHAESHPNG